MNQDLPKQLEWIATKTPFSRQESSSKLACHFLTDPSVEKLLSEEILSLGIY